MLTESEIDLRTGASEASATESSVTENLVLERVTRRFGSVVAVDDVSLQVPSGQLVSFLGPSGCGKTTLLRLIAGLDNPNAGTIRLAGEDITKRPAHQRDIGMVFQSLALFPHLDVRRNIGYGLKIRRTEKAVVATRVAELLRLVDLDGLADRQVSQLSGGQRQRVAIARALARNPAIFLLDEPMSALDANLRESLQVELRLLQQQLGITTIMVTHDQREAMTMSDVIVVLNQGRIEQVGPPLEVYRSPKTAFTAKFLGATNLLRGRSAGRASVKIEGRLFDVPPTGDFRAVGADMTISARPADAELEIVGSDSDDRAPNRLPGTVSFVRDLGATFECFVDVGLAEPIVVQGGSRDLASGPRLARGDVVRVHFPMASCVVVDDPERV
jgi:putative spermidine/putrescine transport system ATP-binding protein